MHAARWQGEGRGGMRFFASLFIAICPSGNCAKRHFRPLNLLFFMKHSGKWSRNLLAGGAQAAPRNLSKACLCARKARPGRSAVLPILAGPQGLCALRPIPIRAFASCSHALNRFHSEAQANRRRLRSLKAKSDTRPMTPMTMMPKMICPVLSSAWLSTIMWPMPLDEPMSSATMM